MSTDTDRTRMSFALADATAVLARTPQTLDAMLRGLPESWLSARERADSWSPFDIIGHLIHGELTDWIPRVRRVLEDGESLPFEKFDRFAQFRESAGKSLPELLDEFARLRDQNLQTLAGMEIEGAALDRLGTHPELGTVTLRQLLATWVAHDLDHVMQIARVMATQYADEVGPWRAYLRIISGQPG